MADTNDLARRSELIEDFRRSQQQQHLFAASSKFINYWYSLPKKGLLPEKSSVKLSGLGPLAPGAVMLQQNRDNRYRIRLFGTANLFRWGIEATDAALFDFVAPHSQQRLGEIFAALTATPCGVILNASELYTSGRLSQIEIVLLPLRRAEGGPQILLGMMSGAPQANFQTPDDLLAMAFHSIGQVRYLNVGAGIPAGS